MQSAQEQMDSSSVASEMSGFVIDDHPAMRRIVCQILGTIGITKIAEYAEGTPAWECLNSTERAVPDFIICDLHMEGMDGLQFINKVRRSKNPAIRQIPVLVLTGDQDDFIHGVADQTGAARVLQKPISAPDMREEIVAILGIQL